MGFQILFSISYKDYNQSKMCVPTTGHYSEKQDLALGTNAMKFVTKNKQLAIVHYEENANKSCEIISHIFNCKIS